MLRIRRKQHAFRSDDDPTGDRLVIRTGSGTLSIYSVPDEDSAASWNLFAATVLCCDWLESRICCGSRDAEVVLFDVRSENPIVRRNLHNEEVCGVLFHRDGHLIATSSNDAVVKIWDIRNFPRPMRTYDGHSAAVRALCWSPTAPDVIASGGGTTDKTIRIWNVATGEDLASVNTGSQVCNLFWNDEYNEVLSTHGVSQYQIALWRASDLTPITQFYEHKRRVLFLGDSPDGTKVVTAAPGDDMRIWKI
jgi:WD40 repeat protein